MKTKQLRYVLLTLIVGANFLFNSACSIVQHAYDLGVKDGTLLQVERALYANRFYGIPDNKRDSVIRADQAYRTTFLKHWTNSLIHLHEKLPDWMFLDSITQTLGTARILPIMKADTIGVFLKRSDSLSIIPLTEDEYLIYQGKHEEAGGYYNAFNRIVVLRQDLMADSAVYSMENALLLLHELCHDYVARKHYLWSDSQEHAWIKTITDEAKRRLQAAYPGLPYGVACEAFAETKAYSLYVLNDKNCEILKKRIIQLEAFPQSDEVDQELYDSRRNLAIRQQAQHTVEALLERAHAW